MKLPGLKRDTAAMLDRAQQDFVAAETQIVSLHQQRMSLLLDAEPGQIEAIDQRLADLHLQRTVFADRISGLEQRLAQEQAEQAERDYAAAVAAIEPRLAKRTEAAIEFERALTAVGVAAKHFGLATENVLKARPGGVDFPSRAYPGHLLSLGRMGQLIESISVGFEIVNPRTRLRVSSSEFAVRAIDAPERVRLAGFAATEKQIADEWLTDLRTAHSAMPTQVESGESEAA